MNSPLSSVLMQQETKQRITLAPELATFDRDIFRFNSDHVRYDEAAGEIHVHDDYGRELTYTVLWVTNPYIGAKLTCDFDPLDDEKAKQDDTTVGDEFEELLELDGLADVDVLLTTGETIRIENVGAVGETEGRLYLAGPEGSTVVSYPFISYTIGWEKEEAAPEAELQGEQEPEYAGETANAESEEFSYEAIQTIIKNMMRGSSPSPMRG